MRPLRGLWPTFMADFCASAPYFGLQRGFYLADIFFAGPAEGLSRFDRCSNLVAIKGVYQIAEA